MAGISTKLSKYSGATAKSRGSKLMVTVEVLQNGASLAKTFRSLNKLKTLALVSTTSLKAREDLGLPHYPLPNNRVEFLFGKGYADENHTLGSQSSLRNRGDMQTAMLRVDPQWEGLATSRGTPHTFEHGGRKNRDLRLYRGDYASLTSGDLRIMIKVAPAPIHASSPRRRVTLPEYRPWIWNQLTHRPEERWSMLGALMMTAGIMGGIFFGFANKHHAKPQALIDINEKYMLSFIGPEHLRTAPEALQTNLDRSRFTRSTIEFYQSFVAMLMGWPTFKESHLYPTSLTQYARLYRDVEESIQEKMQRQKAIDDVQQASESSAVLTIPAVIGESMDGSMLRIIDKIGLLQESLVLNLDARRVITKAFPKDPTYDFEDYRNAQPVGKPGSKDEKFQEAMDAMASAITGPSDEQHLYLQAERLADAAALKQKQSKDRNGPLIGSHPLNSRTSQPIAMPEGIKYASFTQDIDLMLADEKAHHLEALEFGKKAPPLKRKEPLVGEIDPHLIERFIRQNRFQLQLCYELALRRNETASGTMEWKWRIDSRGLISDLALISTGIKDPKMVDCIERKIMSWRFPRPRKGSIEVSYPFEFVPTKG